MQTTSVKSRKWALLVCAIAMLVVMTALLTLSAGAQTYGGNCGAEGNGSNLTWTLDSATGVLEIQGTGKMMDYSFDNMPWYAYRTSIRSVVIKEGVASVGHYAFYEHTALKELSLASTVRTFGENAFAFCSSLESHITIPEGVTEIDYAVFKQCRSIKGFTLPSTLKTIGFDAFRYCEAVTEMTLPEGLTMIDGHAFSYCTNLKSINLPDSLTQLEEYAFDHCVSLAQITVGKGSALKQISGNVFSGCSGLKKVFILGGVEYIAGYAFRDCTSLSLMVLPDTLKTVADHAFYGYNAANVNTVAYIGTYYQWDKISFGEGNTRITKARISYEYDAASESLLVATDPTLNTGLLCGLGTFTGDELVIPERYVDEWSDVPVVRIYTRAFENCKHLTSVTIPKTVTAIEPYAFYGCSNVTSVEIPSSVTYIGDYTFYGCSRLESLEIPSGVTAIDRMMLNGCDALESIVFCSPDTEIYDNRWTIPTSATIYGYEGSTAQAYATKYGRTFVALDAKINTANIALGSDITVYYYVTMPEQMKDAVMEFRAGDKTATVAGTLTTTPNRYVFAFEGITPQMIGDNISVRVLYTDPILGELEVASHDNYSVKKYCLNMMNAGADALGLTAEQYAALTTLVADTLEYGAKVQLYRGYHTDALVNVGITGQSTFVPLTDVYAAGKTSATTAADCTRLSGASAVLDNTIRLRFSFVTSDVSRVTLKIGDTVYDSDDFVDTGATTWEGESIYSVDSAPLSAHQMEDVFTLSLCVDGIEVQSYAYGVVNYLYSKQNDSNVLLSDLIRAIRNYGLSAVAYRAAMGQ